MRIRQGQSILKMLQHPDLHSSDCRQLADIYHRRNKTRIVEAPEDDVLHDAPQPMCIMMHHAVLVGRLPLDFGPKAVKISFVMLVEWTLH